MLLGWSSAFSLLSPQGRLGRLSILLYHRVRAEPDPLFPSAIHAEEFEKLVVWLSRTFNVLPLREAIDRCGRSALPSRALCVTFDDGYADNLTVAAPILARHGVPATVFVASSFLNGGCMWNDMVVEAIRKCVLRSLDLSWLDLGVVSLLTAAERRHVIASALQALKYRDPEQRLSDARRLCEQACVTPPTNLMLTTDQLRRLPSMRVSIGAHTMTHPILARVSAKQAKVEISGSKSDLQALLGEPVELFAYPNGKLGKDFDATHVEMVKQAGFKGAVTTVWGSSTRKTDPYLAPRFTPWGNTDMRRGLQLARNMLKAF